MVVNEAQGIAVGTQACMYLSAGPALKRPKGVEAGISLPRNELFAGERLFRCGRGGGRARAKEGLAALGGRLREVKVLVVKGGEKTSSSSSSSPSC